MRLNAAWWDTLTAHTDEHVFHCAGRYLLWLAVHYGVRNLAAKTYSGRLSGSARNWACAAAWARHLWPTPSSGGAFRPSPCRVDRRSCRRIQKVLEDADRYGAGSE